MTTVDEQLAQELESLSERIVGSGGFASEYRDLARQRRFERSTDGYGSSEPTLHAVPAVSASPTTPRLSDDPYNVITEMSRLAERLVDSRERLARAQTKVEQLEEELAASHQRVLASRAIVLEAQRTAQDAIERSVYLEGRCDALELSLDEALHASVFKRWAWRRTVRRSS